MAERSAHDILIVKGEQQADVTPVTDDNTVATFTAYDLPFDPYHWDEEIDALQQELDEADRVTKAMSERLNDEQMALQQEKEDTWARFLGTNFGPGYYKVYQPYQEYGDKFAILFEGRVFKKTNRPDRRHDEVIVE